MDRKMFEDLIRSVYRSWKQDHLGDALEHPDEEMLVGFVEKRLSEEDERGVKEHMLVCERCSEIVSTSLTIGSPALQNPPVELLVSVKGAPAFTLASHLLEVVLKAGKKSLEIISSSGDLLVGQELIPASVLRSRSGNELSDEVTVLKDYEKVRVHARIERQEKNTFKVTVSVTCKQSHKCVRDVRITLMKDTIELESYLAQGGYAVFEQIIPGSYVFEVTSLDEKLAVIVLDIRE